MASHFTNNEWLKIDALYDQSAENFGLPENRTDSVIIGSFNIRKLGGVAKRTPQSWNFLKNTIARFDLIVSVSGLFSLLHSTIPSYPAYKAHHGIKSKI